MLTTSPEDGSASLETQVPAFSEADIARQTAAHQEVFAHYHETVATPNSPEFQRARVDMIRHRGWMKNLILEQGLTSPSIQALLKMLHRGETQAWATAPVPVSERNTNTRHTLAYITSLETADSLENPQVFTKAFKVFLSIAEKVDAPFSQALELQAQATDPNLTPEQAAQLQEQAAKMLSAGQNIEQVCRESGPELLQRTFSDDYADGTEGTEMAQAEAADITTKATLPDSIAVAQQILNQVGVTEVMTVDFSQLDLNATLEKYIKKNDRVYKRIFGADATYRLPPVGENNQPALSESELKKYEVLVRMANLAWMVGPDDIADFKNDAARIDVEMTPSYQPFGLYLKQLYETEQVAVASEFPELSPQDILLISLLRVAFEIYKDATQLNPVLKTKEPEVTRSAEPQLETSAPLVEPVPLQTPVPLPATL